MTQLHTKQSAFDFAFNALRERGFTRAGVDVVDRHGDPQFKCRYRGEDNAPCAVGLFIPNENYSVALEYGDTRNAVAQCPSLANLYNPGGIEFLSRLQAAHDAGSTPGVMESNLRNLAAEHNLEVPA